MPASTLSFTAPDACTDTTLPIQYLDPAVSPGTLFCYDTLDPLSWPSQAAPSGASTLFDLSPVAAAAAIAATAMGWSNGFVFDSGDTDTITLPASSKFASDTAGFGLTFWVKFAGVGAGIVPVLGIGDDNLTTQYSVYRDAATLVARIDGSGMAAQAIAAATVYQMGFTSVLSGGNYSNTFWLNGVAVKTSTTTAPMAVPTMAAAKIGSVAYLGVNGDNFTFYRAHGDNLSTRTAAAFIAADYAAGVGRFS